MSEANEYCQSCGVAISEPSAFCHRCGAALITTRPAESPTTAPTQPMSAAMQSTGAHAATGAPGTPGVYRGAGPAGPGVPASAAPAPGPASPAGGDSSKSSRKWVPYAAVGGAAALVAVLVAVLLLTLGGSAGKNLKSAAVTRQQALQLLAASGTTTVSNAAPGLFALVTTGKLTAIVPAGWRATAQATAGTTRAEFTDPKQSGSTLTIVSQGAGGGNAHKQAGAALKAVKKTGDAVSSYGPVTFPGGREAWQVTYTHAGLTNETYFFAACGGKAAMVVEVATSSASFQRELTTLTAVAASAEPTCS